jgi:hypothetical protein
MEGWLNNIALEGYAANGGYSRWILKTGIAAGPAHA